MEIWRWIKLNEEYLRLRKHFELSWRRSGMAIRRNLTIPWEDWKKFLLDEHGVKMSSTVSWVNISPGFTGKELQELQGCCWGLQKGWGNLNAGDPQVIPMTKPCGKGCPKAPSLACYTFAWAVWLSFPHWEILKKAAMSSNHCLSGATCFILGKGIHI